MEKDELQEYIHTYKSNLLRSKDREKGKIFESGNQVDIRLASQLLLIASALLTIIGGLVTSGDGLTNDAAKVILTSTIIFLLLSIGAGLVDFYLSAKFHKNWGYHLHQQGRLIVDDKSKTYEELESLRDRLQHDSDKMPTGSPVLPRILQVTSFLIGLIFLLILVIAKIYA